MEPISVRHRIYGRGQIIAQNDTTLRIRFEREGIGEKSFLFPDAFAVHLRYEDSDRQSELESRMEEARREKEEAAAAREANRLRALAEAKKQRKVLAAARRRTARKTVR